MKKIFIFLLTVLFAGFIASPVLARNTVGSPSAIRTQNQDAKVADLKTRADTEITRRVTSLTSLSSKIDTLRKLSTEDKTKYKTGIQDQITTLNNLKVKIDADTDIATLKTDVQSIVKDYRVYLLYMPQVRILVAGDRMGATADLLSTESTELKTKIDTASSSGHDVTSVSALLLDMNSKIADAKTQYQNSESLVTPLTPQGYPGNKPTLEQARADIKAGASDLQAAHKDAMQIKQALKAFSPTNTP